MTADVWGEWGTREPAAPSYPQSALRVSACRLTSAYGEEMTDIDVERKIRQHDNDISAIYTMIAEVQNTQRRHTNRFDELTEDVKALGGRMDSLDTRMTSLEGKVDSLDTRMTSVGGKVDSLGGKVDQVLDLLKG